MWSIRHFPTRSEYTIWTACAPDAVFAVRTLVVSSVLVAIPAAVADGRLHLEQRLLPGQQIVAAKCNTANGLSFFLKSAKAAISGAKFLFFDLTRFPKVLSTIRRHAYLHWARVLCVRSECARALYRNWDDGLNALTDDRDFKSIEEAFAGLSPPVE